MLPFPTGARSPRVVLTLPSCAGVPCWAWRREHRAEDRADAVRNAWLASVELAYDTRYSQIRPLMRARGQITKRTLLRVAAAHAAYADWDTGRNCRPSVALIVDRTGLSESTVQRARRAMRFLGVATEVFRGRLRTKDERLTSWRSGDRNRGWTSVYCLHNTQPVDKTPRQRRRRVPVAPHPEQRSERSNDHVLEDVTTRPAGEKGRPAGDPSLNGNLPSRPASPAPSPRGLGLARQWLQDGKTPPWARRHTPGYWAPTFAAPENAGWDARDVNTLLADWALSNWIPDNPHRPIGLMRAVIATHSDEHSRPADPERARDRDEAQARARARVESRAEQARNAAARALGRQAVSGPGLSAAHRIAAEAARSAAAKRAHHAAAEAERIAAAVEAARTPYRPNEGGQPWRNH